MKGFLWVLFLLNFCSLCHGQATDSIMRTRTTGALAGIIPTSYSHGYRSRAKAFQQTFQNAASFYEAKYHKKFKLKLAVLDSTQWPAKEVPFGYMFYDRGWAMIPARVPYQFFLHLYGIEARKAEFEAFLRKNKLTPNEIISSVYLVYSLHELGHYFIEDQQQEQVPDMFANEMIATYFSYNYFRSINSKDLKNLILFSKFIRQNYNARYHKIGDMDRLYTDMPIQNFKWYHCNIVLLCGDIYNKKGGSFIGGYLSLFAKGTPNKYSTAEVVTLLDKQTDGAVQKWADDLEANKLPSD